MSIILSIYAFALGAAFGSFCNMFVYRVKKGESFSGRSYCDITGKQLKWKDLIPILSFIIYKGRCRECGQKISAKYPVIEFFNGIGFMLLFLVLYNFQSPILLAVFAFIVFEVFFIGLIFVIEHKN